MSESAISSWLAWHKPNPKARLRLFCFPYGGGAAGAYRAWQDHLPSSIEVCPVQIPGRENRLHEPCYTSLDLLVEATAEGLAGLLDKPFAFFGHSMGAMLGFELARYLRQKQLAQPVYLFASGRRPPHVADHWRIIYNLERDEFIVALRELNSTRKEVFENDDLLNLLLPMLRADYEIVQTYRYRPGDPFKFPVTAFGGEEDIDESKEHLEAWREQTRSSFSLHMFPGNHFFIHSSRQALLQIIREQLKLSLDKKHSNERSL